MKYLSSVVLVLSLYCSPSACHCRWTLHGGAINTDLRRLGAQSAPMVDANGVSYAAWTQERNPSVNEQSGIYVAKWDGTAGVPLGGDWARPSGNGISYPNAYSPSIAIVGT